MSDPILAGDARVVLPATFTADIMLVDPPYRAHVHDNATSQDQHNGGGVRHNDLGFASLTEELRTWICQLAARVKRWSIIYTDIESVSDWKRELELAGATYIRTLPWVRWSSPQLSGDRPPQGFECLVVAHGSAKGRKHWNGAGNLTHLAQALEDWNGVSELLSQAADGDTYALTHLAHLAMRGAEKHKTQKPLDQLLDLVSWFSDPGETIVDPCAGSGTTGLAAKILGRNFVGCELNSEWWEKGNARINSCNVGDLPGSLSERDSERFLRWVATTEKEKLDSVSRKQNTERVRKRLADKRAFLSLVPSAVSEIPPDRAVMTDAVAEKLESEAVTMQTEWTEAYKLCLAECAPKAPKPSAAERTISLPFVDEHPAKKWRTAYELAILELAPPLSPVLRAKLAEKKKNGAGSAVSSLPSDAHCGDVEDTDDPDDPDFVAPPRDDSECGFTQPDGSLASVNVVATSAAYSPSGVIPPHILVEVGMHPSLVDEPVRNRALVVARHTGWKDDWTFLMENAPTGFFTRVLKEVNIAPGERLSELAKAMCDSGLHVTPFDVAGWSPVQRQTARACLEQGTEWPDWFTSKYGATRSGVCPACERGDERPYTHVCPKGEALGEQKRSEPSESKPNGLTKQPAGQKQEPKQSESEVAVGSSDNAVAAQPAKRGRPAGTKNKAPKAWKDAMVRAATELAS